METREYRMKIIHIIWWTMYVILTRTLFAAAILFVSSFIFVPFSLDQILHISFAMMFNVYLFLFIIYISVKLSKRIIYLKFDDSKFVAWSLFRRYEFKWDEIRSIDETVKRPRFSGISHGGVASNGTAIRKTLDIKTDSNNLSVELSLYSFGNFTESFGASTEKLVSELKNLWMNKVRNYRVN